MAELGDTRINGWSVMLAHFTFHREHQQPTLRDLAHLLDSFLDVCQVYTLMSVRYYPSVRCYTSVFSPIVCMPAELLVFHLHRSGCTYAAFPPYPSTWGNRPSPPGLHREVSYIEAIP